MAAITASMVAELRGKTDAPMMECKKALTEATHREIVVRNDASAWAALLMLHGGEQAAKKGGPLHGCKSHQRAALAAVVAAGARP